MSSAYFSCMIIVGKAQGVGDMSTKVGILQQFNRGVSNKANEIYKSQRFTKIC